MYLAVRASIEVRSRDRWMRPRLLQYRCRIWERDRRRYRAAAVLRPIVPMVFYLGGGRGTTLPSFMLCCVPSRNQVQPVSASRMTVCFAGGGVAPQFR